MFTVPPVEAATSDGRSFPVGRIICVGRNYAEHAREMGGDPDREAPFFFTKWADAVLPSGATLPYPPSTSDFHHEAELVVAIGKASDGAVSPDAALDLVWGYAAGLDMTRRDQQSALRKIGRPWDAAKNGAGFAPLGAIHPVEETGHLDKGSIRLTVNGAVRQDADIADLIWSIPELISEASKLWALKPGDLIFTGTPAGVGPVVAGDVLRLEIAGLSPLDLTIGAPL